MLNPTYYTNIAAYKFVELIELERWQALVKSHCQTLGVKGTILLSQEGINIMLSGKSEAIDEFSNYIKQFSEFDDLEFKFSYSPVCAFKRMLVKIKKEIITFGMPQINPAKTTAPYLSAAQLKAWLDEGKEVCMLDTRNMFEVDHGTFTGAVNLAINNFHSFADAIAKLDGNVKTKPVVTFCTGGIRCEKASAYLLAQGYQQVYQLQGGILKYFEECQGAHYQGNCFVFDERVALQPDLTPA